MNKSMLLKLVLASTLLCGSYSVGNAATTVGTDMGPHHDWKTTTDIGAKFQDSHKPQYYVVTVQPITHYHEHAKSVRFVQAKLASHGGTNLSENYYLHAIYDLSGIRSEKFNSKSESIGTVGSIGIGYRQLGAHEHAYWGVNAFYDRAFQEKVNRMSVGLEYVVGQNEFHANVYKGLTSHESDTLGYVDGAYIVNKVPDGYDVGYARAFKNAQWVRAYADLYHWKMKHNHSYPSYLSATEVLNVPLKSLGDRHGYRIGTELKLTPHVRLDVGYNKLNHQSGEPYVGVMYSLGKSPVALWGGKHSVDTMTTARHKMLDKVHRSDFVIQRYFGEMTLDRAADQL